MKTMNALSMLAATFAVAVLAHGAAAQVVVPPPTGLTATWAGYNVSGQVVGVSLTWNADSAATSYDVYRGTAVDGQPIGNTSLIASGVTSTGYYDPGITMGVDVTTYYQVAAVNSLGISAKSNIAIAANLPAVESTIQGTVLATPGPIPGYITVQVNPYSCPAGQICPDYIAAPENFLVDIRSAIYEASDGTPVAPFPILAGTGVVVTGNREPGSGTPTIQAVTIEHLVP